MRTILRTLVAEFIGTFALTFVGGAAIMATRGAEPGAGLLIAALAYGLVVALMVSAFMRVSAAFNPATSLALLVTGHSSPVRFAVQVVAQLGGAVLAAYALQSNLPPEAVVATRIGGQQVSTLITTGQAIFLEAAATFFMVTVFFGTVVDQRSALIGGVAVGAAITADVLAIGALTGASMNPARTFGPALVSGIWEGHAIYWIGPIAGAVLAGLVYQFLFMKDDSPVTT